MSIFDSHCHPQFPQYDNDREEMLKRASAAGVSMICVGTDLETSRQAIELAQKYDNIWATIGIHPNENLDDIIYNAYAQEIIQPKVVAIGEVGLDYYRTPEPEKQEKQKEVFKKFLDLAVKYNKPVIIHCRDAAKGTTGKVHKDLLEILTENCKLKNLSRDSRGTVNCSGVAHSFTGNIEDAREYLEKGFCLGFNGIITFARQYDEVIKYVPLENILLETDAPYLAPEPYRGQRNEPAYVIEVAKKVTELKNIPLEKVVSQTTQNARRLFKIDGA